MTSYVPVHLAYETFEPVNGTDENLSPVIFLHGLTASKENWGAVPQLVANNTQRKAYAIDARNHGDSEWNEVFNFDINIRDLFHFMDANNIPKAVIVGHSMGGKTAINAALRNPERVEALVVEDMFMSQFPKFIIDLVFTMVKLKHKATEFLPVGIDLLEAKKFILEYVKSNMPPSFASIPAGPSAFDMTLKKNVDGRYSFKANMDRIIECSKDLEQFAPEEKGKYEGPACFIYGELSPFGVASDESSIKSSFPKAKLVGIEGATHCVHGDKPQEFTQAVLKFLTEL